MPFKEGNKLWKKANYYSEEYRKKCRERNLGKNNPNWKGGRIISGDGYIRVYCPNHPYRDVNNKIKEERIIMENHLGRYLLPNEIVHHIDENKLNNNIENLKLFNSMAEHMSFHMKGKKIALGSKRTKEQSISQSNRMLGHNVSEITRQKISKSNLGNYHTEETKKKMSIKRIGKKDSLTTRLNKSISMKKSWDGRKNND